jgi:hypothetical protein
MSSFFIKYRDYYLKLKAKEKKDAWDKDEEIHDILVYGECKILA